MNQQIIGFKLKFQYPGCRRHVGSFEPYTTGEFLKYPDVWEPVYKTIKTPVQSIPQTFTGKIEGDVKISIRQ